MFPRNTWYVACTARRDRRQTAGSQDLWRERRPVPCRRGQSRGPGRLLPASRRSAVARARGRRQAGMRLSRPGDGLRRQDDCHARPARARLPCDPCSSGDRAVWLRLGLARRPGLADPAKLQHLRMGREPGLGLWRRPLPRPVRLPADDRQPDGPDARELRALDQHRPEGNRRNADHDQESRTTWSSPAASWKTFPHRRSGAWH